MAASALECYLKEINLVPLLNAEEEKSLAGLIRKGDPQARERMIRANLRLVVSVAKNYVNRGLPFMDLIEEGNVGLLKAVERFDPAQECRFSTYATWWIKQAIRRALINTVKTVRIPSYMVELIAKWKNAAAELTYRLGRAPIASEVARELDLDQENITVVRRALRTAHYASNPVSIDHLWSLHDLLEDERAERPDQNLFNEHEIEQIEKLLSAIDEREAMILRMRYGIGATAPLTLREIGNKLHLTRERVRQIENEALKKLHQIIRREERYS